MLVASDPHSMNNHDEPLSTALLMNRTKADLPVAGVRNGAHAWCYDGRKTGEGAAAGTGVPVFASLTAGVVTWIDYRTGIEVTV